MGLPRLPRPDEVALHIHSREGGRVGPISRRGLQRQLASGAIPEDARLWMEGMEGGGWLREHHEALLADLDAPSVAPRSPEESEDDYLDRVFGGLVRSSWDYLEEHRFSTHIDEVFLGAVITSTLDVGYSLIDLKSDGTHHYLRFEDLQDQSRIVVRLTHLTSGLALSKVLGQRSSAVIGYGEKLGNVSKIMTAIRAEMKSGYIRDPEPGTITVDGDLSSGYVYCQVDLYLDIDAYVERDYTVHHDKLATHIGATTHALRKYLRGRFA